jgi:DNA-binding response OmpR family regulator
MQKKHRILYAEDDATLAYLTADNLSNHQYEVDHYADGQACLDAFRTKAYDICIFDVMLPGIDGYSLAEEVRKLDQHIPIIFLSAKTLKEDRIKGLRLGADDYLVKPFSIEELVLKVEIFINRSQKNIDVKNRVYKISDWQFDPGNFLLENKEEQIYLTQREAELLKFFLDNKNKVLKREEILNSLWGQNDYFMGRSLDVFVSRLRKIFSKNEKVKFENVHSIGFKFVERE